MQNKFILFALVSAMLVGGCGKQTRLNTEKLQNLSSNILQFEQSQSNHMTIIRSQVASLGPLLDKINGTYFEKSHENAFFYHTNTLYLLLTVDRKIEAELQTIETERQTEHLRTQENHTNQMELMRASATQTRDALAAQQSAINAETRKVGEVLSEQLQRQIKSSAAETAASSARLKEIEADLSQIKRELDELKAKPGPPNYAPASRP